jgi:magnesium transporter
MRRRNARRVSLRSAAPAAPAQPAAPVPKPASQVMLFDFDEQHLVEKSIVDVNECIPFKDSHSVTWINVDGLDPALIDRLGKEFDFHSLLLDDIIHADQRPKTEDYGSHIYVVIKMLDFNPQPPNIEIDQLSLILGSNYVITFQEKAGDSFDALRERIRKGAGRLRRFGPDYLAYGLLDSVVDHYFVVLEKLGEKIEDIEDVIVSNPTPDTLRAIHDMKRDLIFLRKSVWPLRDIVSGLQRSDSPLIQDSTRIYLRDLYDHVIRITDQVDTLREILSGNLDIYHSSVSNRTNGIMKVLTLFSSIFMPLTFITGLFWMNFKYFPELEWRWGFIGVMVAMGLVTTGMIVLFRAKKWL